MSGSSQVLSPSQSIREFPDPLRGRERTKLRVLFLLLKGVFSETARVSLNADLARTSRQLVA